MRGGGSDTPSGRRGLTVALVLLVSALLAASLLATGAAGAPLRVGAPVPPVALPSLSGPVMRIPDEVRGKVAVLHFWATGCSATCRDEMASLETLHGAYRQRGVAVVAVNVGQRGAAVREFMKGLTLTYPVLLDPDGKAARAYDAVDLPRTIILDRNGLIRYKIIGGASEGTLRKMILSLI